MESFIPIREVCKILGLKYISARNFAKNAKIKTLNTPAGQTLYSKQSLLTYIDNNTFSQEITQNKKDTTKCDIFYCRVSSKKQDADLQRQVNLARVRFPSHEIITDIGSGINWKRPGLKSILERAMQGNINSVTIFHKDRLARFAFDLIRFIFETNAVELIVLDQTDDKSTEQELAEDLLSIVHIYSSRAMGKRGYSKDKFNVENTQSQVVSF